MTRFEEDIEELYQANVHLHKDMHALDDKLDSIQSGIEARIEEIDNTLTIMLDNVFEELDWIQKKLDRIDTGLTQVQANIYDKLDRIEKLLLTMKPAAPPTAGTNLR